MARGKPRLTKDELLEELTLQDKLRTKEPWVKADAESEEGLLLIECMTRDGMTVTQIANAIGVVQQTFSKWKAKSEAIKRACSRGKAQVDGMVENALLKAALGYKTTTTRTYINGDVDKNGNREVRIDKTETEVGPNVTACLAWLNNRKPEQWRRNRDNDMIGIEDKKTGITINIVKGQPSEAEEFDDEDDE